MNFQIRQGTGELSRAIQNLLFGGDQFQEEATDHAVLGFAANAPYVLDNDIRVYIKGMQTVQTPYENRRV